MNEEFQLKLQAYFDGELPEREAREIEAQLANDAEGRALLAELRNTQGALAGFEAEIKLPESREFYWSKIQREIQRADQPEAAVAKPSPLSVWRRFFMPAGAFAALALVGLFTATQLGVFNNGRNSEMEAALADSGAFTYRDQTEQMTVVWLSYPAENEFADTDAADTIQ